MIKGVTCKEGVKDSPDSRNYALNYIKKTKKKMTWKLTGVVYVHTLPVCVCVVCTDVCMCSHLHFGDEVERCKKNNKGIKINKNIKDNEISSIRKSLYFIPNPLKNFK